MITRGIFVNLEIDVPRCLSEPSCRECVSSCPVNVFSRADGEPARVIPENEDECILCDLCVDRCPVNAVSLRKLY